MIFKNGKAFFSLNKSQIFNLRPFWTDLEANKRGFPKVLKFLHCIFIGYSACRKSQIKNGEIKRIFKFKWIINQNLRKSVVNQFIYFPLYKILSSLILSKQSISFRYRRVKNTPKESAQ